MAGGRKNWTARKPAKVLTLAEKIAVIKGYEKVCNYTKLARTFNCSDKQIRNTLLKKDVFLAEWKRKTADRVCSKLSVKRIVHGAVVNEWVQRCRSRGLAVFDKQILSTAQESAILINMEGFRPTLSWVKQLKTKFKMNNCNPIPVRDRTERKKSLKLLDILQELTKKGLPERFKPYILDEIDKTNSKNVPQKSSDEELVATTGKKKYRLKTGKIVNKTTEDDNDEKSDKKKTQATKETTELTETITKKRKYSKSLSTYQEALKHLSTLERFALVRHDDKAMGFINQLESLFKKQLA